MTIEINQVYRSKHDENITVEVTGLDEITEAGTTYEIVYFRNTDRRENQDMNQTLGLFEELYFAIDTEGAPLTEETKVVLLTDIIAEVAEEILAEVGDTQPDVADENTVSIQDVINEATIAYTAGVEKVLGAVHTLTVLNYNKRSEGPLGSIEVTEEDGRSIVANANDSGGYQLILTDSVGKVVVKRYSAKKYALNLLAE